MLVQAESANWLGNLFNWFFFTIFAGIATYFGWIFVFLGAPTWFYDFVTGLNLLPPAATSYSKMMN